MIGIVGLGFVGLSLAVAIASKGYTVIGVDIDRGKVELIRKGEPPFHEPGLREVLGNTVGEKLHVSDDYRDLMDADVVFICVGTPTLPDGRQDRRALESAIHGLAEMYSEDRGKRFRVIAVKSTVLPGTTRELAQTFSKLSGLRLGVDYGFAMNPEFLREGRALEDTLHPSRVVIGCVDDRGCRVVEEFYREFYGRVGHDARILLMSAEEAELVKYASNLFLATRISYANNLARICEAIDNCDILRVLEGTGLDPRIGTHYLRPGLGYGGSCLPKDVKALKHYMEEKRVDPALPEAVDRINETQPLRAVQWLREALGSLEGKIITVLGLAFKPGTDDIRDSVSLKIINELLEEGAAVRVHDLMALKNVRRIYGDRLKYYDDPREALRGSDGAVVATEWDIYRELGPEDYAGLMRTPVVIDGRRIYDPWRFKGDSRIRFYAVGLSRRYSGPS